MKLRLTKKVSAIIRDNHLIAEGAYIFKKDEHTMELEGEADENNNIVNNVFINGRLVSSSAKQKKQSTIPFIKINEVLPQKLKTFTCRDAPTWTFTIAMRYHLPLLSTRVVVPRLNS